MSEAASKQQFYYGVGRRKSAIARVRLYPGEGKITVNASRAAITSAAASCTRRRWSSRCGVTGTAERFDVMVTVVGGGVSGQAGAIRHGISRALVRFERGAALPAEAGQVPHARRARQGAQEGRSQAGPQGAAGHEALARFGRPSIMIHRPRRSSPGRWHFWALIWIRVKSLWQAPVAPALCRQGPRPAQGRRYGSIRKRSSGFRAHVDCPGALPATPRRIVAFARNESPARLRLVGADIDAIHPIVRGENFLAGGDGKVRARGAAPMTPTATPARREAH